MSRIHRPSRRGLDAIENEAGWSEEFLKPGFLYVIVVFSYNPFLIKQMNLVPF